MSFGIPGIIASGGFPASIPSVVVQTSNGGLLAQILQGVQAGTLALTSYYQGQAVLNTAKASAEAAKYNGGAYGPTGPTYVTGGAGASASGDMTPILIAVGGLALVMMMSKSRK
jgi:hypothetical protein